MMTLRFPTGAFERDLEPRRRTAAGGLTCITSERQARTPSICYDDATYERVSIEVTGEQGLKCFIHAASFREEGDSRKCRQTCRVTRGDNQGPAGTKRGRGMTHSFTGTKVRTPGEGERGLRLCDLPSFN